MAPIARTQEGFEGRAVGHVCGLRIDSMLQEVSVSTLPRMGLRSTEIPNASMTAEAAKRTATSTPTVMAVHQRNLI